MIAVPWEPVRLPDRVYFEKNMPPVFGKRIRCVFFKEVFLSFSNAIDFTKRRKRYEEETIYSSHHMRGAESIIAASLRGAMEEIAGHRLKKGLHAIFFSAAKRKHVTFGRLR